MGLFKIVIYKIHIRKIPYCSHSHSGSKFVSTKRCHWTRCCCGCWWYRRGAGIFTPLEKAISSSQPIPSSFFLVIIKNSCHTTQFYSCQTRTSAVIASMDCAVDGVDSLLSCGFSKDSSRMHIRWDSSIRWRLSLIIESICESSGGVFLLGYSFKAFLDHLVGVCGLLNCWYGNSCLGLVVVDCVRDGSASWIDWLPFSEASAAADFGFEYSESSLRAHLARI